MNSGRLRLLVFSTATLLIAECKPSPRQAASSADTTQGAVASASPASPGAVDTLSLGALIDSLARLPGDFSRWGLGRWEFNGDAHVLRAFDAYADTAVVELAECLDRTQVARATAKGRPVSIGVMCYWALSRLAYYEWPGDHGWPGMIEPTATPTDLRAAKQAWLKVVREGRYSLM